jgi:putative transposase
MELMGFGYRLYHGYNGVDGKGIDKMIDQLIAKHDELPVLSIEGGCYFFTVALAERWSRLLTENIQGLRAAFREVKQTHPFKMGAVVILPDHLHCICTLPEAMTIFRPVDDRSKAAFSRQLPDTERRSKSRLSKGEQDLTATILAVALRA